MTRYLPQQDLNIEQSNAETTVRKLIILSTIIVTEGHDNSQLVLQWISIALVSVGTPSASFCTYIVTQNFLKIGRYAK